MVISGLSWVHGDGSTIRFWKEKWLLDWPVSEMAIREILNCVMEVSVRELWRNIIGWVLSRIAPFVSNNIILQLAAVVLDNVKGAKDRIS